MDFTGPRTRWNPAWSTLVRRRPPSLNGEFRGTGSNRFSGVRCENRTFYGDTTPAHIHVDRPSDAALFTEGAAMANPANARNAVSLPVSLIELREFPRLLKNVFNTSPARIAGSYVEYKFGYAPMVSDLQKLFQLPKTIEDRIAQLNFLRTKEKVSRTRTVWSADREADPTTVTPISWYGGFQTTCLVTRRTSIDVQVTSSWRIQDSINSLTDPEMASLAWKLSLGLTPQAIISQGWDLLPWSWLIDWFTNFGDFISLTNNSVAYLGGPGSVSTVEDTILKYSWRVVPPTSPERWFNTLSFRDGVFRRRDWTRGIHVTYPSITGPFLDGSQTSILASIASSRLLSR